MSKQKTVYCCQECGHSNAKWLGRCPMCEAWNSFVEERVSKPEAGGGGSIQSIREEYAPRKNPGGKRWVTLNQLNQESPAPLKRYSTGISELDRVLGGGLVTDSLVLLGGEPGIGKSTLLLQMAAGLSHVKVLYVSGEESVDQIQGRAKRLGIQSDQILLAAITQLEEVLELVRETKPKVLVMDSIQTFATQSLESAPGSVGQVREVAARLMALAKSAGIAVLLVGHVTKDGNIAGPKVVEHLVDTVLYFEGDSQAQFRLLRAVKNRFGSVRELGVFEMEGAGLQEVKNPSRLFLSDERTAIPGVAVTCIIEGSRPMMVELQALVVPSPLSVPRRTVVGIDPNRISLIAAILERHNRLKLAQQDLFVNVAGGLKMSEPVSDLAVAAAIWSSFVDQPLHPEWIFMGELGLTGEIRKFQSAEQRIEEARKLGFKTFFLPKAIAEMYRKQFQDVKFFALRSVQDLKELPRS